MVGSAKSDIDGYEELVAELRATAAKHAKELETGLKEAVRLNPAADILFTLDDLANKDASIWDVPTVFVAGVPYISGGVYKSGTKILRTWKKAPREAIEQAAKRIPASEKQVKNIAKRIERELGKDARREFHDLKDKALGDRTMREALDDAVSLYEDAGKDVPQWLLDRLN